MFPVWANNKNGLQERRRHKNVFIWIILKVQQACYTAPVNCFRKRKSFSLNKRRSLIWYFNIVIRSTPIPNAKPVYFLLSMPQLSNRFGCTIPQPKISTQPVCLQTLQPLPPQIKQLISISALGSVNGK